MRDRNATRNTLREGTERKAIGSGEKGSIIVIAIFILALLTLGGIVATRQSSTEAYIVRNSGLQKQNLQLADMGAMIGLRSILGMDADDLKDDAFPESWTHSRSDWNDNPFDPKPGDPDSYPLDDANSMVPAALTDADPNNDIDIIADRGEANDSTLRYYFVGWSAVAGQSISLGAPAIWRSGRVVGIYDSDRHGRKTVEIGLIKRF